MQKYLLMMAFAIITTIGFAQLSYAEPFTFEATTDGEPSMAGIMTPDGMVGSANLASNGVSTYVSGTVENWSSTCTNFSSPQIDYDAQGFCITTIEGTGDALNVVHVCNNTDVEGENDCWGYFAGGSGKYEKASGTLTWRTSPGGSAGGGNLNTE